jgi:hypothetical protein
MKYLVRFFTDVLKRPSVYFFIFLVVFSIDRHKRLEHHVGEMSPFSFDVFEYYRILPDYFINDGKTDHAFYKTTMGMAIMYSPAFFVADQIAQYSGAIRNGYSEPYRRSMRWISIIYCILGLWFCRKSLVRFFNESVTLITIISVLFATNLFYYTFGWGQLPHSHLFFLYSAFIYATLKWIDDKSYVAFLWLCFIGGFITLVRPTGIIVFLFPVFYKINSLIDIKERLSSLSSKPWHSAVGFFFAALPFLSQMVFWKIRTGNFLYWSYLGERFFFNDPQIINFLFSYRKGWFVYTPIMIFSVIGIVISYDRLRQFFIPVLMLLVVNLYLLSSWWEWSYGGSFGCRAIIEFYAFLVFPLATFVSWCWRERPIRLIQYTLRSALLILFYFLIRLNLWQTTLYRATLIHWNGMNKETYWYIMKRDTFGINDYEYLKSRYTPPDQQQMLSGDRDQ